MAPSAEAIASGVLPGDRLVMHAVSLRSPGFWEFLGKLNPLEVLRQYLNDRHERRKDREYRESAERERLIPENLERENKVLRDRIEIVKGLGATQQDLAPLLNDLVHRPLLSLDRHQDAGIIAGAEFPRLTDADESDRREYP